MNDKTDVTLRALLILAMLAAAILACNFNSGQNTPDVSVTELVQSLSRTQTAEANEESSTNDLATAQAKATALSLEIGATQTAMAAQQDVNQLATATIAAPILAAWIIRAQRLSVTRRPLLFGEHVRQERPRPLQRFPCTPAPRRSSRRGLRRR